jgi:formate dehydrogenase subunit gamma
MAVEPRVRVARFGVTERRLHTIHGAGFAVMLGSGLVLYLPFLAQTFSSRPFFKAVHLLAASAWLTALALLALCGDRAAIRQTRRELERLDGDDLLWLRRRRTPQGRFNAGQKLHACAQAGLAVLFVVSGILLWLGERDTALRLPGTIALHDAAMFLAGALVTGHVYMVMSTPGALDGILHGTVSSEYAAEHHAKWVPGPAAGAAPRPGPARLALAAVVVALGVAAATLFLGS